MRGWELPATYWGSYSFAENSKEVKKGIYRLLYFSETSLDEVVNINH